MTGNFFHKNVTPLIKEKVDKYYTYITQNEIPFSKTHVQK